MSRSIAGAWLAGLLLFLLVLLLGANSFWLQLQLALDQATAWLITLSPAVTVALRAAAIGLALTAILLARLAARQNFPVRGVLAGGAVLWLILVVGLAGGPPGLRWGLATIVAGATALSLTRRPYRP